MSLVNAVHELIEVAAGRRNLSGPAADELHAAIDAEQNPPQAPGPTPADGPSTSESAPVPQPIAEPENPTFGASGTLTVGS